MCAAAVVHRHILLGHVRYYAFDYMMRMSFRIGEMRNSSEITVIDADPGKKRQAPLTFSSEQ